MAQKGRAVWPQGSRTTPSLSCRRPVAAGHLAGLRGDHLQRRRSIAAPAAAPNDAAAAAASAAGERPHPFLPLSKGEKSRNAAERKRAAAGGAGVGAESPAVVSSAAGSSPSPFPSPALWQLRPPPLLGNSRIWGLGGFKSQACCLYCGRFSSVGSGSSFVK